MRKTAQQLACDVLLKCATETIQPPRPLDSPPLPVEELPLVEDPVAVEESPLKQLAATIGAQTVGRVLLAPMGIPRVGAMLGKKIEQVMQERSQEEKQPPVV